MCDNVLSRRRDKVKTCHSIGDQQAVSVVQISVTAASGYLGSTALYFRPSALLLAADAVLERAAFLKIGQNS